MANGPLVKIFLQISGPNLTKLGRKHQYGKKDNYETVKKVVCLKKNIFFKNNAATLTPKSICIVKIQIF